MAHRGQQSGFYTGPAGDVQTQRWRALAARLDAHARAQGIDPHTGRKIKRKRKRGRQRKRR